MSCTFCFFSSRRRHTSCGRDWSSDVCSSDLRDVHTVEQFQLWLTGMLELLLKRTCKKIEVRGLDRIPLGQTHLWLSNHRDIAMDPLLINYSLHKAGWPTSRIAIGDNLLSNDRSEERRVGKECRYRRSA